MIASLHILFKTKKTLDYLDGQYADKLNIRMNLIFAFFGAFALNIEPDLRPGESLEYLNGLSFITLMTISILFGMVFGVLVYRFFITFILFGLSRLLKGTGELIDLRVVLAYSLIPLIIREIMTVAYKIADKHIIEIPRIIDWSYDFAQIFLWILMIKILVQGFIKFNDYGLIKGLINVSPIVLYGLGWYGLYYFY